jgi:alpha-tubulin suppressor-like RCC1 family protein
MECRGQTLGEALGQPDWAWTTGGNTPWLAETNVTWDGIAAVSTGDLVLGQANWLQTTVTGPVAVTYWAKVSTCSAGLSLSIGGTNQGSISGQVDWQEYNFYVPSGAQTLLWSFNLNCTTGNSSNMAWLGDVALSAPASPSITTQPTNQTVAAGNAVTLASAAGGTGPLQYQWLLDGTNLSGSTAASFSIADAQAANAGSYSLVVSSLSGVVTSQVATVTVLPSAPIFTKQPFSQACPIGAAVSFTAAVEGTEPFGGWQWYSNGLPVAGATTATLTVAQVQSSSFCQYWAVVTNAVGTNTSDTATLSFSPVAVWGYTNYGQTAVPPNATNVVALAGGDEHCLALLADGTVTSWGALPMPVPVDETNAVSIGAGSWDSLIANADGSVLLLGQIIFSGVTNVPSVLTNVAAVAYGCGAQHALVLRADGTAFDWGVLSPNPFVDFEPIAALLTNMPKGATNIVSVTAGAYHCVALRADGTVVAWGDNTYGQTNIPAIASNVVAISTGWYHNLALRADGRLIQWGTSEFYNVGYVPAAATNIVAFACGGNHSLALRADGTLFTWGDNSAGQCSVPGWVTNVVAVAGTSYDSMALLGDGPPVISAPILNRSVVPGGKVYFRASAVGVWPLSYQWQLDGTNLAGATNALLVITNAQPAQMGAYSVVVTNVLGAASSPCAWLTVVSQQASILSQSLVLTNGQAGFTAIGPAGLNWRLQTSTDLVGWLDIMTPTNVSGTMQFSPPATNCAQCFYRLRLAP